MLGCLHQHSLHAQENTMSTHRWLLPFTHGVDMRAIDDVVFLAENAGAILVAVSLVSVPQRARSEGARLEHIEQSKDFLEALQYKAARRRVSVERYEVFTTDVIQSITSLTHETQCTAFILVTGGKMLRDHEMKHLLTKPPATLMLIRRPLVGTQTLPLRTRFLAWLRRLWTQKDADLLAQNALEAGEPDWIKAKEYHHV
jgi:hypothetical protein